MSKAGELIKVYKAIGLSGLNVRSIGVYMPNENNYEPDIKKIRSIRENELGITQEDLANKVGCSTATIFRMEQGRGASVKTLKLIAKEYGLHNWKELTKGYKTLKSGPVFDYPHIKRILSKIDDKVLKIFRDREYSELFDYNGFIESAEFGKPYENFNLSEPVSFFSGLGLSSSDARSYYGLARASLEVVVEKSLESISYNYGEKKVEVENPELLWPCNCKVNEALASAGIADPDETQEKICPIHEDGSQHTDLAPLFSHALCAITYCETPILWQKADSLWPPSVDAFNFLAVLDDEIRYELAGKNCKTILDVGCGTGILGIYLAKALGRVEEVTYSDWMLTPLLFSHINHLLNLGENNVRARYVISDKLKELMGHKFDIAVCNPPYLKSLDAKDKIRATSTVAGTDILEDFIANAPRIARYCYISFSDIALDVALDVARNNGRKLIKLRKRGKSVPFRVQHAIDSSNFDYVFKLIDAGLVDFNPRARFPITHVINVYQVV